MSMLFDDEIALVGDVAGQRLLHLLCNSGQDTLSWAKRGAEVTGVDLSDAAIEFATSLSSDAEIAGRSATTWRPPTARCPRAGTSRLHRHPTRTPPTRGSTPSPTS
jgi:hypothetical protein